MSGDKLDPFIERSETVEKMGAERPGVLVPLNPSTMNYYYPSLGMVSEGS